MRQKKCDRIAIINKGELVALDSTENLIKKIKNKIVKLKLNKNIEISDGSLNYLGLVEK